MRGIGLVERATSVGSTINLGQRDEGEGEGEGEGKGDDLDAPKLRALLHCPAMKRDARDPRDPDEDPVARVLAACREHHEGGALTALAAVLEARREMGDTGASRALSRTLTLAELRLDPASLMASVAALVGVHLDGSVVSPEPQPARDNPPATDVLDRLRALPDEATELLEGVERLAAIHWDALDEESAESLRRMFVAMAADVRVVLITLADRLEVIRALRTLDDVDSRQRIARETREVFAPLANRLGIWQLKWELEDLAMRELEPETYREITGKLAGKRAQRQQVVDGVIATLEAEVAEAGVVAEVSGRPKHIYSIVKKMRRKGVDFEDIFDVTAVRVIVEDDSKRDCYAALGMVHGLWTPIASEFDDYIARPKDNGYQSLHTAVVGPGGEPLEIQIRTRQMHLFSEFGVAAHWRYKEGGAGRRDNDKGSERFNLLRQLVDWQQQLVDPRELAEALKTDLFEDQVHVFTPGGDVIDLPVGATALDFAYRIHTLVGHRCRGARVNGVIVPLTHKLKTGDRVEILTKRLPEPSRDWLSPHLDYLRTSSAKQKIRQWFRKQDRGQAIVSGRDALERELVRAGVGSVDIGGAGLDTLAWGHDYKSGDDLLAAIGFGDVGPHGLAAQLLERERPAVEPELELSPAPTGDGPRKAAGVSIGGVGDILSQPARCCSPVPGDEVIGWISRGRGIAIHRRDCPNVIHNREPERLIEIDWGRTHQHRYPVKLSLEVLDQPGALRDIAEVVSNMSINMRATHSSRGKKRTGIQTITLELEVDQATQVIRVLARLETLPVVVSARRVAG